jgi:hypothetical protein
MAPDATTTTADRVNDTGHLIVGLPTIDSVMAALNPKGVPLTDADKRRILAEARDAGRLSPLAITCLTDAGWLTASA